MERKWSHVIYNVPHEEEKAGYESRILVEKPNRSDLPIPAKTPSQKHEQNRVRFWHGASGPSQNGGNGPHPEESLPSAGDEAAAITGRRTSFLAFIGEDASRSNDGRSCLPHIRFPPSPTAPIGLIEMKLQLVLLWLSRSGLRTWAMVVACEKTRDSMAELRSRERERERNVILVPRVSS